VPDPKNVVVIGGSFGGFFLAKQLSESLPTGYRVVLIEKHSHFHFTWNFPRISVVSGHSDKAFIPYPRQPSFAPAGVYSFRQGTVVEIDVGKVILEDGSQIPFEYLAIATGSQARYPARLDADEKPACIKFFQAQQDRVRVAEHIVIVGGGAAGVEVAGDIKTKYPSKTVTLVHSREELLNSFGKGLHGIASNALEKLGVEILLGERVTSGVETEPPKAVVLRSGKVLQCDTLVSCPTVARIKLPQGLN
jgi:NADH dehydrogenase FAD-containing subunit